jgi:hypothetical protein
LAAGRRQARSRPVAAAAQAVVSMVELPLV